MKNVFAWILILSLSGACASRQRKVSQYERLLDENKCEEALEKGPSEHLAVQTLKTLKQGAGYTGSYAVTGLAAMTDATASVLAVGGQLTAFCILPSVILHVATFGLLLDSNSNPFICVVPGEDWLFQPTHFTKASYQATGPWRCPDFSSALHHARKISQCFSQRRDRRGINLAFTEVRRVIHSPHFRYCLDQKEMQQGLSLYRELASIIDRPMSPAEKARPKKP